MARKLCRLCRRSFLESDLNAGVCSKCKPQAKNLREEDRPSARKRGYDTRWDKASRGFRKKHPLCAECLRQWRLSPSEVVDHVVPHRGDWAKFWDSANWQPLCERCHNQKTRRESNLDAHQRYVVTGPPGAGKTTWVAQRRKPGDIVWDYDEVAKAMLRVDRHETPEDCIPLLHGMALRLIEEIATNPPPRSVYVILPNEGTARIATQRMSAKLIAIDMQHLVTCEA